MGSFLMRQEHYKTEMIKCLAAETKPSDIRNDEVIVRADSKDSESGRNDQIANENNWSRYEI